MGLNAVIIGNLHSNAKISSFIWLEIDGTKVVAEIHEEKEIEPRKDRVRSVLRTPITK